MPTTHHGSPLEAALSYYSSIVTVSSEGDSLVSDETLEGLGTAGFLLQALFGSLLKIANPDIFSRRRSPDASRLTTSGSPQSLSCTDQIPVLPADMAASTAAVRYGPVVTAPPQVLPHGAVKRPIPQYEGAQQSDAQEFSDVIKEDEASTAIRLTDVLPDPGYFLAGAVSGAVSRTATAPLDRLKVYLLVSTKTRTVDAAIAAAKDGRPVASLRHMGGPIVEGIRTLWKAGGMRTFFAGNSIS
jgi:solute carrier family 25 phosphate transporter 23/24/25/41